jgi:hypothetical protein
VPSAPPPTNTTGDGEDSKSFLSEYWWVILLAVGGVALIGVVIFLTMGSGGESPVHEGEVSFAEGEYQEGEYAEGEYEEVQSRTTSKINKFSIAFALLVILQILRV